MICARAKSRQVVLQPATSHAKYSFSRGLRTAITASCWPRSVGFGGRCGAVASLLQAQVTDIMALSAICNAATVATPRLASCAHTRGVGAGAGAHDRARLSVASVAMLQITEKIYLSIGYKSANLQRRCNGCNAGLLQLDPAGDGHGQSAINNGRISAGFGSAGAGGSGSAQKVRFGARAGARWGNLRGARPARPGAAMAVLVGAGAADGQCQRFQGVSGADRVATQDQATQDQAKAQRYQRVSAGSPLVSPTGADGRPICRTASDLPPPCRRTPPPKPDPRPQPPACVAAIVQPTGGQKPAKLRNDVVRVGVGHGTIQRGPGGREREA
jgi:hypothetical protein